MIRPYTPSDDPLNRPIQGAVAYNPDLLSPDELRRYFVARLPLLDRILEDLEHQGSDDSPPQHRLIVGARGMGKTTLLRRIAYAIAEEPALDEQWLPLIFPEEQYNIASLSDLWLNCIDALGDTLERLGKQEAAEELDRLVERAEANSDSDHARHVLDQLLQLTDKLGKRLVLLVDNLDLVLGRLKHEHWAIREVLSSEPRLLLIGATAQGIEATYEYEGAFYDFFKVDELKGLSEKEMRGVLINLATIMDAPKVRQLVEKDRARIRTLHTLTGGNPRTTVLLFGVLSEGIGGDVRNDLERLLDQCTPLYKARFEELPAQAQQLVDRLAIHWNPMTAAMLAEAMGLAVNHVSAQLKRLGELGVVEKVPDYPGRRTAFQISERFFNIWYLMRASRRVRRRLLWLVECLKMLYSQDELLKEASRHLSTKEVRDSAAELRNAEYRFALAQTLDDAPTRRVLEHSAITSMMRNPHLRSELYGMFDFEGEDAALRESIERVATLEEIKQLISKGNIRWPEGSDRDRFFRLFMGRRTSLVKKKRNAKQLAELSEQQIAGFTEHLEEDYRQLIMGLGSKEFADHKLDAYRLGLMSEDGDIQGAETAARQFNEPRLINLAQLFHTGHTAAAPNIRELEAKAEKLNNAIAWTFAGWICYKEKQLDEARGYFQKSISIAPDFGLPYRYIAVLDFIEQKYSKSEEALQEALTKAPRDTLIIHNLAIINQACNRPNEAEHHFHESLRLYPFNEKVWSDLSDHYLHFMDSPDKSKQTLTEGLRINPGSPDLLMRRAHQSAYQGDTDSLPTAFEQFLIHADPEFIRENGLTITKTLRMAVEASSARQLAGTFESTGTTERYAPHYEALKAVGSDSMEGIQRLAPELRGPTEEVLEQIAPEWLATKRERSS